MLTAGLFLDGTLEIDASQARSLLPCSVRALLQTKVRVPCPDVSAILFPAIEEPVAMMRTTRAGGSESRPLGTR